MGNSFSEFIISNDIIAGLEKQNITSPTEIQSLVIPDALQNKDIIGESYTGSGKTLAYLIPVFQKIDCSKRENQVLILAPTHELVMQIDAQVRLLAENSKIPVYQ
jgi:superfamily II DNA/RNA helicase